MKRACALVFMLMLILMLSTAYATSGSSPFMGSLETFPKRPRSLESSNSGSLEDCVSYLESLAESGYDIDNGDYVPEPCCRFFKPLGIAEAESYLCENVKKLYYGKVDNYYLYVEAGIALLAKCKNKSPAAFSC